MNEMLDASEHLNVRIVVVGSVVTVASAAPSNKA